MAKLQTSQIVKILGWLSLVGAGGVMAFWFFSGAHMVTQEEQTRLVVDVGIEELDDDEFQDVDDVDHAELYATADDDEDGGAADKQADSVENDDDPFEDDDPFGDDDPFDDGDDGDPFGDEDPFEDEDNSVGEDEAETIEEVEEGLDDLGDEELAERFDDDELDEEVIREAQFGLFPDRGYDGAAPLAGFLLILGVALLFVGRRISSDTATEEA